MDTHNLFSDRMLEDKDFSRGVIDPTNNQFDEIHSFIDIFPDLVDVDYVNKDFLSRLGDFLGFKYLESESPDVQREIIKRVLAEYKKKGSIEQLNSIVQKAYSDNYYLGDLTYYKGKIESGYSAISYPRDSLFRYDGSKWDSARYPDNEWYMFGTIDIQGSKMNERTIKYLDEFVPAGLRYRLTWLLDLPGTEDHLGIYFPYIVHDSELFIQVDSEIPKVYKESVKYFIFDRSKLDKSVYQGGQHISSDVWDELPSRSANGNVHVPDDVSDGIIAFADEKFLYNFYRYRGDLDPIGTTIIVSIPAMRFDSSRWDAMAL